MNLYEISVPLFIKNLNNLKRILEKGKAYATQQGINELSFIEARLASDMFPLSRQVQIASDNAKGISASLAGVEKPVMEDTEKTFTELVERCEKTISFLETLRPEQFERSESKMVPFRYVEGKSMTGYDTLLQSSLPNFFFHITTAYNILRHQGVPIGKADYIGDLPLK